MNVCNSSRGDNNWLYSDIVKNHFFNPRNFIVDEKEFETDGIGEVGSIACGDMMKVFIQVYIDEQGTERIKDCKWQTFGCASAIASTSMMSVMALEGGGMTFKEAKRLKPQQIIERLGGLPEIKFHCSVLGHEGLREAILDYESRKLSS